MKKCLLVILICTILLPLSLKAAETTTSEQEMKERIMYIQQALDEGESAGRLWWSGFTFVYGVASGYQLNTGLNYEDKQRPANIVGGTKSLLGALSLLIAPFPAAFAPDKLRETPDENIKAKLEKAEFLLKASAQAEKNGKSWMNHALSIGVNTAGALVIGTTYSDYLNDRNVNPTKEALASLISGIIVSELQIWLQPSRAIDDWNKYEQKYINGETTGKLIRPDNSHYVFAAPIISTNSAGLVAGIFF
jgi:hypothetical protein